MKKLISIALILIVLLGSAMGLTACKPKAGLRQYAPPATAVFGEMRTISAKVYMIGRDDDKLKTAYNEMISELKAIDAEVSTVKESSFIYQFNHASGKETDESYTKFYIDEYRHVLPLITRAYEFYEESSWLFNPAIYPLMELWNLDADSLYNIDLGRLSEADAVKEAHDAISDGTLQETLALTKFDEVITLTEDNGRHYLTKLNPDAMLDFGGQAKGYGANLAMAIADKYDILIANIDIGGNIATFTNTELLTDKERAEWSGFNISVSKPCPKIANPSQSTETVVTFNVQSSSAVTSGDYQRRFTLDEIFYAHILDPLTGYPLNLIVTPPQEDGGIYTYSNDPQGLTSVTIVDPDSELADVYAKIVILLGMDKGIEFLESTGKSGILLSHDMRYAAVGEFDVQPRDNSLIKHYTAVKGYAFAATES